MGIASAAWAASVSTGLRIVRRDGVLYRRQAPTLCSSCRPRDRRRGRTRRRSRAGRLHLRPGRAGTCPGGRRRRSQRHALTTRHARNLPRTPGYSLLSDRGREVFEDGRQVLGAERARRSPGRLVGGAADSVRAPGLAASRGVQRWLLLFGRSGGARQALGWRRVSRRPRRTRHRLQTDSPPDRPSVRERIRLSTCPVASRPSDGERVAGLPCVTRPGGEHFLNDADGNHRGAFAEPSVNLVSEVRSTTGRLPSGSGERLPRTPDRHRRTPVGGLVTGGAGTVCVSRICTDVRR